MFYVHINMKVSVVILLELLAENQQVRLGINLAKLNPETEDVTLLLHSLHWLLVFAHIRFRILMLAYKAKNMPGEILCGQGVSPGSTLTQRSLVKQGLCALAPGRDQTLSVFYHLQMQTADPPLQKSICTDTTSV